MALRDQMHRFRARAFKDRRGWRVDVTDGRETDSFDAQDVVYFILTGNDGRHVASLRLLPTTGPYMMADVFPEVLGDLPPYRSARIWESSRFCVDTHAARVFGEDGVNRATRLLLHGMFSTAVAMNLENIVSVYDIYVEKILRRAGCVFTRIGPVVKYDRGLRTTAGLFEVSEMVAQNLECPEVALTERCVSSRLAQRFLSGPAHLSLAAALPQGRTDSPFMGR